MRKNINNNKIIRAMAIGLATVVVATSMPLTVFAEEDEQETVSVEESGSSSEDTSSAPEEAAACNEANETADAAADLTQTAETAVEAVAQIAITDQEMLAALQEELTAGAGNIADTQEALAAAAEAMTTADAIAENADSLTQTAEETVAKVNKDLDAFDKAEEDVNNNAGAAIKDAETANTTDFEKEANEAKINAEEELDKAEAAFTEATEAYDAAAEKAVKAEEEYETAKDEHDKAVEALEEARKALEDAKTNATAAQERLKAAESKVNQLEDKVKKLEETKEDLEAIRDQYYAMMVWYYRDMGTAVYDGNTLDVEESAKAALESGKVDTKAISPAKNVLLMGRNLMEKLVTYMIVNSKGVAPENIEFAKTGKKTQPTNEGEIFVNKNGEDQAKLGESGEQKWDTVSGNGGRYNHVTVKYTDKDGNEVTEWYNYILKSEKYGDDTSDLANGPIYLALITSDENGNYSSSRVDDENNYDNYQELVQVLEAVNDLSKYEEAVSAVSEAKEKVDELQKEVERLENMNIDGKRLEDLKDALDEANKELESAKTRKDDLEEKVEEAREAVASIDLSRFNKKKSSTDSEEQETTVTTTVIPTTAEVPEVITFPVSVPVPAGFATPAAAPAAASGVLGVRVENETPSGVKEEIIGKVKVTSDKDTDTRKIVMLEDVEVPLSASPMTEEGIGMNWWWVIALILILMAVYALSRILKESENIENNNK